VLTVKGTALGTHRGRRRGRTDRCLGLKTVPRIEVSLNSQQAPVDRRLVQWARGTPHAGVRSAPVSSVGNGVTKAGEVAFGTRIRKGAAQPGATRQRSNRGSGQVGFKQSTAEVSALGPAASVSPGLLFSPGQAGGAVSGCPGEQGY